MQDMLYKIKYSGGVLQEIGIEDGTHKVVLFCVDRKTTTNLIIIKS